ncbi:exodeoxyribonuclease V beta chain [Cutibacterium acnes JCM 18909]|nr:exodeoxyribonuclease V beta chain [Cutibacterium acnes JCM 18909]
MFEVWLIVQYPTVTCLTEFFTWHPRPELIEAISERLGGLHD